MPNYITIKEFQGGLGNQLTQIYTMLSLSLEHNLKWFLLPQDKTWGGCPIYFNYLLDNNEIPNFSGTKVLIQELEHLKIQYIPVKEILKSNTTDTCFILDGIFANTEYYKNYLSQIEKILYKFTNLEDQDSYNLPLEETVVFCGRFFTEEKRPEWIIDINYYRKAIEFFSKEKNILFMSDDNETASKIMEKLECKKNIIYWQGTRDCSSDLKQLRAISKYKNIVLTNSSFHIHAIFLSDSERRVIYPKGTFMDSLSLEKFIPIVF